MFILRRITQKLIEINTCLGSDYVFITRERNDEEFKRTTKEWLKNDTENVYGLITFKNGEDIMPLYKKSQYYIMTSDGKTFSNISLKE